MMLKHTLSFVIFMVYLNLNAQWKKIFTSNQNDLYDVQLIRNTGYICGINSTMLKTTDTGKSWKSISLPTFLNARTLYFKDSATGFVTGENARILKTTNGGTTWVQKHIKTAAYAYDIAFNGNNGLAVGNNAMAIRSYDFGETWQTDTTFTTFKRLNSVCILSDGNCWAVGDSGIILHKNVLQKRWQKKPFITNIHLNDIQAIGDSILLISGGMQDTVGGSSSYKNIFLMSKDSGRTWQQTIFNEMRIITKAWYSNKDTAYFIGNSGLISKSYHIFNNRSLQLSSTANSLRSINFVGNTGIIIGDGGLILRTSNSGGFRLFQNNFNTIQSIPIFPNPSNGNVFFNNDNIKEIKITDITGKIINFDWLSNSQIFISQKGCFILEITDKNNRKKAEKLVIF